MTASFALHQRSLANEWRPRPARGGEPEDLRSCIQPRYRATTFLARGYVPSHNGILALVRTREADRTIEGTETS